MKNCLRILALVAVAAFSGCQFQLVPGTDPNSGNQSSTYDPSYDPNSTSFSEVAENPAYSEYYTEPSISYGYPGDGLADNYDTSSTYLASVTYDPTPATGKGAVAQALQSATQTLMAKSGIVGTGAGIAADGSDRVVVFAASNAVAASVPAQINGVATEVKVIGRVRAFDVYTSAYRPVVPSGVSVGNSRENSSGTIGAIVVKHGIRYMLSNNHVLARSNAAVIGEPIVQPGRADNYGRPTGQVGVLSAYKKVSFTRPNLFDAAVARLTTKNSYDQADQFTPSHNWQNAQVGMAVKKVGRTTGLTYGTVAATNVTIKVDYDDGNTATFTNQIYIQDPNFLQAGDSGSLLVTESGNHPVGLCFAGGDDGAFANPIGPIMSYFGVEFAGTNN
jgi:hypothetical protein